MIRKLFQNCLDTDNTTMIKLMKKCHFHKEIIKDILHNFDMKHKVFLNMNNRVILYKGIQVFKSYPGYLNDYDANKKTDQEKIFSPQTAESEVLW